MGTDSGNVKSPSRDHSWDQSWDAFVFKQKAHWQFSKISILCEWGFSSDFQLCLSFYFTAVQKLS